MTKLLNGRNIMVSRNQVIDYGDLDFSTYDFSDPAKWAWASQAKSQKKLSDKKALKNWWEGLSVNSRKRIRVNFAAIMNHAPKGLDYKEQLKWWESIGKDKREDLRDKYDGDDILDTINNIAKKGIDLVTLTPIVSKIPVLGNIHKEIHGAITSVNMLPFKATENLIKGKRVDKIALESFKTSLLAAKTLAPYVQTVISFVPGIGTGLSAGLGGAIALASGKNINEALMEGIKSALPGGAVAGAVFDVTSAILQKKPIEDSIIAAIPVSDSAKKALLVGTKTVKALAEGKKVDQAVIDSALNALPKDLQKAAQIGVAIGEAANIQKSSSKKRESFTVSKSSKTSIEDIKKALNKTTNKLSSIGFGSSKPVKTSKSNSISTKSEVFETMPTVLPPQIVQQTNSDIKKLEDVLSILKNRQLRRLATNEHKTIVNNDKIFSDLANNQKEALEKLAKIEAKIANVKVKNNTLLASLI